jgi:hypothetical protein
MNINEDYKIKLKKKDHREVSSFVGQNLMYDYVFDRLDQERKSAMIKILESDVQAQQEFIKITNGIQYLEKLSETLLSEKIVLQISNRNTQLRKILEKIKFYQWPLTLKWFLEAAVIVLAMVVTLNVLPWSRIVHLSNSDGQNDLILAEISRRKKEIEQPIVVAENPQPAQFQDEEVKPEVNKGLSKKDSTGAATNAKNLTIAGKVKKTETTSASQPIAVAQNGLPPSAQKEAMPATKATEADIKSDGSAKNSSGFLYRGNFSITNVEMTAPKIIEKINEFGGRKAGEVEIGWKKTNQVYYFHFTIPQAKIDDLEQFLKIYASAKLKKEPHPRVMPDGIVRILFTLEEVSTKTGP